MLPILFFEIRKRFSRLSTYVYLAVFFGMGALFVGAAGGVVKGATVDFGTGGKVFVNSPYSLSILIPLIGHFGLLVTAAIAGRAICDDFESRTSAFFFTSPITKIQYLMGRFLGALGVTLLLFPSIGLGAVFAVHLPWIDSSRIGASNALAYIAPYLTILIPNIVFTVALFFSIAALTRKMFPVYVGSVVLLIGYLIALNIVGDLENRTLGAMLDPFGIAAVDRVTQYWTIAERNTRLVPLTGVLLANRLVWTGLGLGFLGFASWRFSFTEPNRSAGRAIEPTPEPSSLEPRPTALEPSAAPPMPQSFSKGARARLVVHLTRLELGETVKSVFFLVIVLAGLLFIGATAGEVTRLYGTPTYPVTYAVLEQVGDRFAIFALLVLTIYAGELVWRERDAQMNQLFDALPVPRWITLVSKLGALMLLLAILQGVVMAAGLVLQLAKGYTRFELWLYAVDLFAIHLPSYCILAVLAILVHVLVNQKYLGHFVMVLYYVAMIALPFLGFDHRLGLYGKSPLYSYSDMNGFGHFIPTIVWFRVYWGLAAIALALVANLFWVRGMERGARTRLSLAAARLTRPVGIALGVTIALFACVFAFIFHNTNQLNVYRTPFEEEEIQADYERQYKSYEKADTPRVTAVKLDVDIFPAERRVAIRGALTLENKTGRSISKLPITLPARARVDSLSFSRVGGETKSAEAKLSVSDARLAFRVYEISPPLEPGERLALDYALTHARVGFSNGDSDTRIVENGTFVDVNYLPTIGYRSDGELQEDSTRRKHGLPPKPRMPDLEDVWGRSHNYVSPDADWIAFEATVSTSPDQIAIAPGYLQREWIDGGRRYFHYAMDAKILNIYAFNSARYDVRRDRWNDVAIEIYHHPLHTYDLDRMIRGVKETLTYCTEHFSPYQHRQVRIVEFPRYRTFAQSFPNTIPFSEAIGFIARVDESKEDDIDLPFYVTAHEVAHQWWGHQVMGADVQGSTVMSESLAQYTALMVMKKTYGAAQMKRFLRYELDRYLRGRATEKQKELPLLRVENQPYIHYNKGSLVMYALSDYLGEDVLDGALAAYLKAHSYSGPPYTNATELVDALRAVTPPDLAYVLHDMFETITLYDSRAVSAKAKALGDGTTEVTLSYRAKKLRADELGAESDIPMDDLVDLGVLDAKGEVLALERRRIKGDGEAIFVVRGEPAKAGIDPLNKLIDRSPDDNLIAVER